MPTAVSLVWFSTQAFGLIPGIGFLLGFGVQGFFFLSSFLASHDRSRKTKAHLRQEKSAPSCTSTSRKEKHDKSRPQPSQTGHAAAEDSQHRKP